MTIRWEMDDDGRHRLVAGKPDVGDGGKEGHWTTYTGIATLEHEGRHYFAVSAYFDGMIPGEKVLEWKDA